MGQLRFAPLIRVSTEGQATKGESLRTQKSQIQQYVESLGGIVTGDSWTAYSGQEHSTPDYERKKLDKLLHDAAKGRFDAVIVADASRWSRDNRKSKEGLEVLRQNGIKFFVGTTQYDLFTPEHTFFLGVAAEIGEFTARTQNLKSTTNRLLRAKRGIPSAGKLPYARKFDRQTETWGIDEVLRRKIEWAAEQYLAGRPMGEIAKALGMNHPNLWKVMTKRAGEDWEIRFCSKKLNIDETVPVKIPPLLPPETIEAIKQKSAANKTYTHGSLKHHYLLSRMIFCGECGHAMFGQTNHNDRRYYRHPRGRLTPCDPGLWVPAQELEQAIMVNLFAMFGDIERLEKAVQEATPDQEQAEKLRVRLTEISRDLGGVKKQISSVVDAIAEGILDKEDARGKMDTLRERRSILEEEKARIEAELEALPDYRRQLSHLRQMARQKGAEFLATRPQRLGEMTYAEKRKLVQAAFGGKDREGQRLGVYVAKDAQGIWHYEIKGILPVDSFHFAGKVPLKEGTLPMPSGLAEEILGVDTEYTDFKPLEEEDTRGTRYACH